MRFVSYRRGVWRTHRPLLLLIIFMGLVFLGQTVLGYLGIPWAGFFMAVPSYVMASWQDLLSGNLEVYHLWQFSTLLTCVFLHGDLQHLLFNMLYFWMFGALVLELLGTRWFFAIFLVTGIAGSVVHTVLNVAEAIPVLGASGSVMGFEGAYLALAVRWRLPNPHVWPMSYPVAPSRLALIAVIGIVSDYAGLMEHTASNVAYGAHIGGFLAGVFLAGLIAPRPRLAQPR